MNYLQLAIGVALISFPLLFIFIGLNKLENETISDYMLQALAGVLLIEVIMFGFILTIKSIR